MSWEGRCLCLDGPQPTVVVAVAANTDVLTPTAAITMLPLAVQYWTQPPADKKVFGRQGKKKGITMSARGGGQIWIVSASFFLDCGEFCIL